jgi:hypothetical protein
MAPIYGSARRDPGPGTPTTFSRSRGFVCCWCRAFRIPAATSRDYLFFGSELAAKRLELLKEALPLLVRAALLLNPDNASSPKALKETMNAAQALQIEPLYARDPGEFEQAFQSAVDQKVGAIFCPRRYDADCECQIVCSLTIKHGTYRRRRRPSTYLSAAPR